MTLQDEKAIRAFIENMLAYTVRIMRNALTIPENFGRASGVLVEHNNDYILLTAGHSLEKPGDWTLETSVVVDDKTLHLPLRDIQLLAQIDTDGGTVQKIDLAWARISHEDCKAALDSFPKTQKQPIEFPVYRGPLDEEPSHDSPYGFAAWNRAELHQHDVSILASEPSFEVGMTYNGISNDDSLYVFELARAHQGNEYYCGASGAPIADEEGRIIALVTKGDPKENLIYGVPLARYHSILGL